MSPESLTTRVDRRRATRPWIDGSRRGSRALREVTEDVRAWGDAIAQAVSDADSPLSVALEPLEPRVLLAGDPLIFTASGAADVTLKLTQGSDTAVSIFQLVDNTDDSILVEQALSDTSFVTITGSDAADSLTLDFDFDVDTSSIVITFDGGAGNDSLVGSGQANSWSLTGADAGAVNEHINFSGVENITGGGASDTFVLDTTASVSGTIDGGEGGR